jgi:hypothetical protein
MYGAYPTTMDATAEARDKQNILSFLEEVRGTNDANKPMLMDLLSSIQVHERGIGKLYWQFTQQTGSQELKDKWQQFGRETESERLVAERTISALGGDPNYKSQMAQDQERALDCLSNVQSQGLAGDQVRLGNLVMAEAVSRRLWKGMHRIGLAIKDPATAKILWDAARIAERDTDAHVMWNSSMYESYTEKLTLMM